jgi:hypothetical protein
MRSESYPVFSCRTEAMFVADGRDLKEAVLWSPALATAPARATILPEGHTLLPEPGPDVPVAPPGAFLLGPNPAVTRAGLVEELARRLGASSARLEAFRGPLISQ